MEALKSGKLSTKKNTAFKPTHYSITALEDKKIQKLKKKIAQT